MIRHRPPIEVLEDLRFALEVIEERSHLGLDAGAASTLRSRILTQIQSLEAVVAKEPATPISPEILESPE